MAIVPASIDRTCFTPILAHTLRVARLNDAGAPLAGANNVAVVELIQIGYSVVVKEGANITQDNGRGVQCLKYQGEDKIESVNLTLELCQLDFELMSLLTGGEVLSSGGFIRGFDMPQPDSELSSRVSVEAWSLLWDGDEPAADGAEALALRTIFPSTSWVEGDRTYVGDGNTRITLTGRGRGNANWGNGPGNDLPWRAWSAKGEWTDEVDDIPVATCGASTLSAS